MEWIFTPEYAQSLAPEDWGEIAYLLSSTFSIHDLAVGCTRLRMTGRTRSGMEDWARKTSGSHKKVGLTQLPPLNGEHVMICHPDQWGQLLWFLATKLGGEVLDQTFGVTNRSGLPSITRDFVIAAVTTLDAGGPYPSSRHQRAPRNQPPYPGRKD